MKGRKWYIIPCSENISHYHTYFFYVEWMEMENSLELKEYLRIDDEKKL